MDSIAKIILIIQIIFSIILVISILLQQSSAGLGGALGGSDSSVTYHTRRGFEKILFYTTIVVGILFVLAALVARVIH